MTIDECAGLGKVRPRFPELDTQPFWDATREHRLRYQQCQDCARIVFYPRHHCVQCGGTNLAERFSLGDGTVYTYSVVRKSLNPSFRHLVPYWIAWVDLDEGFRMLTHVVGVDEANGPLEIGQRVRVEWIDADDIAFPVFRAA